MNTMNNISSINDLINEVIAESIENEDNVKFLADLAEDTSAPVAHKAGRHPVHFKGREKAIAEAKKGARAKRSRKGVPTTKAQAFDLCSWESGAVHSMKRRLPIVEDYDRELELILQAYGVADAEELLILADEAWAKSLAEDDEYQKILDEINCKAGAKAALRLAGELSNKETILDPERRYNILFWEEKENLLEERSWELNFRSHVAAEDEARCYELRDLYKKLTNR